MREARHGGLRIAAAFAVAGALGGLFAGGASLAGCTGGGGGGDARTPGLAGTLRALEATLDPGDPLLAPANGFVGSERCLACHSGTYAAYERTAHSRGLRSAGRPGVTGRPVAADSDGDGRDDFAEGLDLATLPAFAAMGADAPRLAFVKGDPLPWKFDIAGVRYEVVRVYGGTRREDYLLRLGRSLYLAPAEYDLAARTWIPLETETWFVGTVARFGTAAAAAAGIDRTTSFERRCAGCHQGGFTVDYDGSSGEWLTGYTEVGTGCESCHGPGRDHAVSGGDPALIANPRRFLDGTADGARRAADSCARCHTRGTGGQVAGSPSPVEYPWSAALGRGFEPGDILEAFLVASADPADYWGRKDNFLGTVPTPGDPSDDSFVAARGGWLQGPSHGAGAHAPGRPGAAQCFDCHDPHGSGHAAQIAGRAPGAPDLKTSDEDGSICLACHAGTAPFADLTPADLEAFVRGRKSGVPASVVDHMKDGGMPVDLDDFQPRRTGVGRCSTCHMPLTVTDRHPTGADPAGFTRGGGTGRDHGALILWPSVSERHGVTNSCNACHPLKSGDPTAAILQEWARGDTDGDGRHHGYTPRGIHLGELNAASGNGQRCARCHTTAGFRGIVVEGDADGLSGDDARLAAIVRRSVRMDAGITCAACHGKDGSGTFAVGENPLRLPRSGICSACHNGAGITYADYDLRAQAPHYPQKEMLDGTAGEPPPGTGFYPDANHAFFADGCVRCHFDTSTPGAAKHDFAPRVATCNLCHPDATSLDIRAFSDYDGDGTVEGIQGETVGLLDLLKAAILAGDPAVTFDGEGFRRNGVPGLPGASAERKRAAYNWEVVSRDGSLGLHNAPRAIRLLQQSYRALTGVHVPGAVML